MTGSFPLYGSALLVFTNSQRNPRQRIGAGRSILTSFASYALERNQIGKVQAWMGHSDLETLSKYVGLAESCPEWLAKLYEYKAAFSHEREAIPASIVFPNVPALSSIQ
jgi:integrase